MSIRTSTKLVTAVSLITVCAVIGYHVLTPAQAAPVVAPTPQTVAVPDIYSLWQDSNNERIAHGLPALSLDPKLMASATAKCADMVRLDDWNHDLKDGTSPQTYMAQVGYSSVRYYTGENISHGYDTADKTVDAWIASPGHEVNLINPHFTAVGYAVCQLPSYPNTVVQQFIGL